MKQLMLGNEAFARGLYEAGCGFVSSYPGTPSTEITECAAKYKEIYAEWAPNEKVAMESALGASLAGKRSFCGMKHVGLNVAADPLFTISYTGVNAGMIIAVADDAGMHSSQNEQDSRHYASASKLPMLEPVDSAEALKFAKIAYELSEKHDCPVIMKMCTRIAHSQSPVEISDRVEAPAKLYEKTAPRLKDVQGAKEAGMVLANNLPLIREAAEQAAQGRHRDGYDNCRRQQQRLESDGGTKHVHAHHLGKHKAQQAAQQTAQQAQEHAFTQELCPDAAVGCAQCLPQADLPAPFRNNRHHGGGYADHGQHQHHRGYQEYQALQFSQHGGFRTRHPRSSRRCERSRFR